MKSAGTKQSSDSLTVQTRPEEVLLICCARTKMEPKWANRIHSLVRAGIDWDLLIQIGRPNGMLPLLYWNLNSVCPDDVPAEALARLKSVFLENHKRNLFLAGELVKLLDLFKSQGIIALAYKGPTIAASIYGNLALRRFLDLDILVRRNDFARAGDLLTQQGYERELKIAPARDKAFLRVNYVQLFEQHEGRATVELHWGVAPRNFVFPFDVQSLWGRAREIELVGRKVLMPSPEDLLLLLCVHGTKDLWDRLEWICGVAELIRVTETLDWETVLREARRTSSTRMLLLGLALARNVTGVDLPPEVMQKIFADPSVAELVELIRSRLFADDIPYGLGFRVRFHLKARERLRDRVRYCIRLAFDTTHGDWAVVDLPAPLSFLYYFVRPFRLLKNYAHPSQD